MNTIVTIPQETIVSQIQLIRGKKVMLDENLARLYLVTTGHLNRAIKRNGARFPPDFMFQLTSDEYGSLICQSGTSNIGRGGRRHFPYVFTEQGVAMLSTVLHSEQAIQMNIQIIRTFSKLREILADNVKLAEKVEKMERKYDKHILNIFNAIKQMKGVQEDEPKEPIGFRTK